MKLFYPLFIICVFFLQEVVAQDWSLVMPNDTLVYECQDNNQFFTVWVDSTEVNGTDTTYFMNRIFPGEIISTGNGVICDSNLVVGWNYIGDKRELSSTQFCGEKIIVSGTKTIIEYDNKDFIVYPNLTVGASWICDSVAMDSMKVLSVDTVFLLSYQIIDFVKVLKYKGGSMYLSKNHGVVSSFDFRQPHQNIFESVGVQNLDLGITIPMASDIFDFKVGDVFYRRFGGGDSDQTIITTSRVRILSREVIGDSIYFKVGITNQDKTYSSHSGIGYYGTIFQGVDTIKYPLYNPGYLINALPNTLESDIDNNMTTAVWVFRNDQNKIMKINSSNGWKIHNICDYNSYVVEYEIAGPMMSYAEDLGMLMKDYNYGLQMFHDRLIGYKKANGESWGDTLFTDVSEIELESNFIFSPNPAFSFINIENPLISKKMNMEIYGIHGKLIQNGTIDLPYQADVSGYSPGIYFIMISDEKGKVMIRKKIVVQ